MKWRQIAIFALLSPGLAGAAEVVFASGPAQVALVELFTSEGCSSCPPAEQWLAERRTDADLWRDFVPVAWHVTYWDQLGWPDRWAQRAFTDRQQAYASAWHSASVYTPCFVRDGVEWRPGRTEAPGRTVGTLAVRYDPQTGALDATFRPAQPAPGQVFELHAVQLGGGLRSQVTAGENAGRSLAHEFVALAVARSGFTDRAGTGRATLTFPIPAGRDIPRRALAVWVTRPGELTPLQATGGWLRF